MNTLSIVFQQKKNLKVNHYSNISVLFTIILFLMILKKEFGGSVRMYLCEKEKRKKREMTVLIC